ncbi:Rhodanese/cell cycle control phosphatase superfamily protein isoform 1 [Dorcoceras hygrometricum]|uniref:Rhodanese/cell cycle control phosphatase superfamily protein isoform 1 n=1 Tax=Dorcoceras hygrometricum TaxID=472368 RepID=A0A2Z7DL41_9LAMI|nr:Rhodanese/cell cycle control phosphatase superfamily protein isoform 1 [Dorcoceras hygrometricum]
MLPVCSTTTNSSCHTQIPIHGGLKSFSLFEVNCNHADKIARSLCSGVLDRSALESFKRRPASCFYSNYAANSEQCSSMDMISRSANQIGLGSTKYFKHGNYQVGMLDDSHLLGPNHMIFVESVGGSPEGDQLVELTSETIDNIVDIPSYADPELTTPFYGVPSDPSPAPNSLNGDVNSFSDLDASISELKGTFSDTIKSGENILNNSIDTITSSVNRTLTNTTEAFDGVIKDITSFFNKSGESISNKFTGVTSDLKGASGRAGLGALDVLRKAVVIVEDSLIQGAKTAGYAYNSAKEVLPPEVKETVSFSENTVMKVLGPVGTAFQQVYIAVEGFEKSLGLDPNDPLVPLVLFLAFSTTLWASYRVYIYGGYAGDLSPKSTLELLQGNGNVVLVDIRPEARDYGIPDLRWTARYRYSSLTVPEVDDSVKKLLKGGRDLEDSLLAVVIRNLKIVEGRSKVLVMDADGSRSKGVARSLRKLGIVEPYLVQGGFRSWVNEGLRIKELKSETALTIFNEEAEAILEEINPTPLKLIGYGIVFAAVAYSVAEWEKTLQFIAVIGLAQTILGRVISYQDAEDIKKDVRFLLTPARLGGQAISWVAGKLETNRNGLPTSPSSSDVRSRVLQAAAKHESGPEETQDSAPITASGSAEVKASEA